jgi:hypothetical protein
MIKVSTTPDASGTVVFLAWTYSSFIKHPEYEYEVENYRREHIDLLEVGSLFPMLYPFVCNGTRQPKKPVIRQIES